MSIQEFNRDIAKEVANDINEAVKNAAIKHGLEVEYKGHDIKLNSMSISFDLVAVATDGKSINQTNFEIYGPSYGLVAEDYGKYIKIRSGMYKIVGFNPKAHKNKLVIESINKTIYVTKPYIAAQQLHKKESDLTLKEAW
jgi:metal-dependent amidase/aminoacylase/carboxypeptidase family protein